MVLHELATNAARFGALSVESGELTVAWQLTESGTETSLELLWTETGGPEITEAPSLAGYGSKLIARSVAGQLGGKLSYDWHKSGLVVTARMRMDRLTR